MSIRPLEGDMAIATDPTLSKMHKKINQLVAADQDSLRACQEMTAEIRELQNELKLIKLRIMNDNG